MATQTRLLTPGFHLDRRSRDAGRRGVARARVALAEARERTARHHTGARPGAGAGSDATRPDAPDGETDRGHRRHVTAA